MEKSGNIVLTQEDLIAFQAGTVSDRIKGLWDLTFEGLQSKINAGEFTVTLE